MPLFGTQAVDRTDEQTEVREVPVTTEYIWYDAYKTAILETDWTKMKARLRAAESEIIERQHVLSMDHGGTPEERQAIEEALNGMKCLQREVAGWQTQQSPDAGTTTPD
jgi:hypothetical protein